MKTEKNNVVESSKKFFSENKSSGQYSYPEWNKDVIPEVSAIIWSTLSPNLTCQVYIWFGTSFTFFVNILLWLGQSTLGADWLYFKL